jgi:hypothetical protein
MFEYDKRLDGLLTSIEETLVAELPVAVARLEVAEPSYALFLWYCDSSMVDPSIECSVGTRGIQNACAQQYDDDDDSRIDCTWRPQQRIEDWQLIKRLKIQLPQLTEPCAAAYAMIFAADKSPLPLEDEGELLLPLRKMLYRAASRLTAYDWSQVLDVDDSFVVVALEYTGYWLDRDLAACVPPGKCERLVKRGLLRRGTEPFPGGL